MALWTRVSARHQRAIGARLARFAFARHPALRVDLDQEGYKNYTFGSRAGPTVDFFNLCHELAHAAQFAPDEFERRCTQAGHFHLPVRTIPIAGALCEEPLTAGCTLRECEVFAIQYHLASYAGHKLCRERYAAEMVKLLSWLPDWGTFGGTAGRARELPQRLESFIAQWSAPRAIDRIEHWLDCTAKRLATFAA